MCAKFLNWVERQRFTFGSLLVLTFCSAGVLAEEFQYFGGDIDYWRDRKPSESVVTAKATPFDKRQTGTRTVAPVETPPAGQSGASPFPWHQYLDPKNKEFFKEGDYTPPEPFMEIVRNPSDSNLKLWFDYIGKKNELSNRLQTRMQEYLAKNSLSLPSEEKQRVQARVASLPTSAPNVKRFRFRLYFDSHCPHCKKMLGTMADLQSRGYMVEARQVDGDTRELAGIPIPVEHIEASELHDKQIQSVPVLLVGDLAKKVAYRINGYQNTAQVLSALPKEDDHE